MKKLILTTSALVLVGGAAVAQDISVKAEATVSYGNWETGADASASFSTATEVTLGLEASAGDLTYGGEFTLEADGNSGGVIWVSGGFGTFSFGEDEFDELNADNIETVDADVNGVITEDSDYGDVKYEGEFAGVGVTFVADVEAGTTPGDDSIDAGEAIWWAELTYSADGFSVGLETDSNNSAEVSASFDAGNFTVGGSADNGSPTGWDVYVKTSMADVNIKATADSGDVVGIELDGSAGDVSWAVAANTDEETSASLKYSMGDWSIGVAYDNDDAGDAAGCAENTCNATFDGADGKDYGDEADIIVTIGYGMDNLGFEVLLSDQREWEVSMTGGFEF